MTNSEPLPLVLKDLSFRYHTRNVPAIRNINLSLEPGQIMLLAGSSGCGKTTLMRCINGLIPHSYRGEMTGEVLIHGQSVRGMSLSQISKTLVPCFRTRNVRFWAPMCSMKSVSGLSPWL